MDFLNKSINNGHGLIRNLKKIKNIQKNSEIIYFGGTVYP